MTVLHEKRFQNCRNVVCYAQIPDFEVDVMPSTYAHFCFGREVLAALPQEMQSLLWPGAESVFHWAAWRIFCSLTIRCSGTSAASATGCTNKDGAAFFRPHRRSWPHWSSGAGSGVSLWILCHFALDPRLPRLPIAGQIARGNGVKPHGDRGRMTAACWCRPGWTIRTSLTGHLHASARSAAA